MSLRGFPEWTSAGWEEVCVCVSDIITIRFSVEPSCFSRCSFNFWFVSHFFIISLPLSKQLARVCRQVEIFHANYWRCTPASNHSNQKEAFSVALCSYFHLVTAGNLQQPLTAWDYTLSPSNMCFPGHQ